MKDGRRRLNALVWWKQLVPAVRWRVYEDEDGQRWFAIWRQWLGRAYDHRRIPIESLAEARARAA